MEKSEIKDMAVDFSNMIRTENFNSTIIFNELVDIFKYGFAKLPNYEKEIFLKKLYNEDHNYRIYCKVL